MAKRCTLIIEQASPSLAKWAKNNCSVDDNGEQGSFWQKE